MEVDKIMRTLLTLGQTRAIHEDMEVDKIMRTLLTLAANSNTPRRHGSGQNNGNITNTRGNLEHSTKIWKWQNNENITYTRGKLDHSTKTWKWTK